MEQILDLKITSFEDIIGRLKTYEERICEEEETQENQNNKMMYANMETSQAPQGRGYNGFNGESRCRGRRGQYYNRGRRRGRNSYWNEDLSRITCFRCDKNGYFAFTCSDRLLKLQEASENKDEVTQTADALMMHEIVYLNEKNVKPK